jgi:hypothetical protein
MRRTPIKPINRERRAARFARSFGPKAAWIADRPCLVCGLRPTEAAHVKSRGAGGTSADLVPLCREHHREQHDTGIRTFAARHRLDLALIARNLDDRWHRGVA